MIRSQAVLLAIGIGWDGRRSILAVELPTARAARAGEVLLGLRERGLSGVEFVVSVDHAGLSQAIIECCRRRPGSGATCTSCATRSITCRARSTVTVCGSSGGSTIGATSPRRGVISGSLAHQVAGDLPQALRLGRRTYRGDARLLPAAAPAPQTPQVDQSLGALERGDQATDPRGTDLSERRELPAVDPRPRGRDA